jgi:UV DNA damage endonuclease
VSLPRLGLVCQTESAHIRYRTITKTRLDALAPPAADDALRSIYLSNTDTLDGALTFLDEHAIRLYRIPSTLFPFVDDPRGARMLLRFGSRLREIGARAARLGIRIVSHPDQFVVLSSDSPHVVANARKMLIGEARVFDALGLPRSPWACMTIHGGKGDRAQQLVTQIRALPPEIRNRIVLENDEYAYHAEQIYDVACAAGVPMVFDAHHHLVAEGLPSYDHPSIAQWLAAARTTWPDPAWQLVHISNGREHLCDAKHSDLITTMPAAFVDAPWIEVEAKRKEAAVLALRAAGSWN